MQPSLPANSPLPLAWHIQPGNSLPIVQAQVAVERRQLAAQRETFERERQEVGWHRRASACLWPACVWWSKLLHWGCLCWQGGQVRALLPQRHACVCCLLARSSGG